LGFSLEQLVSAYRDLYLAALEPEAA
jgi:hypothetical protein